MTCSAVHWPVQALVGHQVLQIDFPHLRAQSMPALMLLYSLLGLSASAASDTAKTASWSLCSPYLARA